MPSSARVPPKRFVSAWVSIALAMRAAYYVASCIPLSAISFGAGGMLGGLLAGSTWDGIGPQWTFTISAMIALAGCLVIGFGWPANRERSAGV
jgi:hypothetical protein